jgi:hypothetical protein
LPCHGRRLRPVARPSKRCTALEVRTSMLTGGGTPAPPPHQQEVGVNEGPRRPAANRQAESVKSVTGAMFRRRHAGRQHQRCIRRPW